MENARKVIDNFEDLQIDEKYINEVFNGQPEYEDIPYYIKFDNYRGLWSDDLFRQYHNIMRQRLYICNLTKVYEEVYEKEQIDKYGIPNEMLEKYKSKTRYEIQMELGQKIDKLVNRDLVSKDTENDKLRLELLKRKLDNKEINKISDENLAEYASKLDIEITKNREILKNKKDLVSKNSQYKGLQQQFEAVKAELNSKPDIGENEITAEEKTKRINLIEKQNLIEIQIQYIDTKAENQAVHMTYDKNKTYSQLQNVDFENVMNKNEGNYEELQMALSKYKQALDKMEDFPEDLKNKMYENASKNISDVRYLGDQRHYDFDGMFHCETGLIGVVVKNPIKYNDYILMHEMTHAATYKEDKTNIENSRIGLETFNSSVGAGINEGMTEYFAIEISKKSNYPNFDSYSDLVSIAENMVNLYGKDTMLDAMVNGPEKLEELMAKDGKSFTEFREMVDDYNRQVYNNKELDFTEASKTEDARKMYSNINGYMEEIRSTRLAKESWFQKENTESKKNLMNKNDEEERYGK